MATISEKKLIRFGEDFKKLQEENKKLKEENKKLLNLLVRLDKLYDKKVIESKEEIKRLKNYISTLKYDKKKLREHVGEDITHFEFIRNQLR